jgi:hypothetical protein
VVDGFVPGVVLWFKPESGRGVVKADTGRQFFIDTACGVDDPMKGLRVLVQELTTVAGAARAELKLPPGGRHIIEVQPAKPKGEAAARRATPRKKLVGSAKTPKKRTPKGVVERVKIKGEALERGIPVRHNSHGHGFVVMSTSRIARVKFGIEERQVRVVDLVVLERE